MLYLTGRLANLLGRGPAAPVASSEDTQNGPVDNLFDGHPSTPFRAGAVAVTDLTIDKDLNLVANPGFETSTLDGWVDNDSGTGASTETTVGAEVHGGTKACKLSAGASGVASRYGDIEVRAGERLRVSVWLRGDATAPGKARIRNLQTNKYLTSAGVWQTAAADFASETGTTYVETALTITVEGRSARDRNTYTLRREVYADATNGIGYADDFVIYPLWNWLSVHGHNLWGLTPEAFWSDNGSAWTSLGALPVTQPSTFLSVAEQVHRWVRFKAGGLSIERPNIGELVAGRMSTAVVNPHYRWGEPRSWPQARHESLGRRMDSANFSSSPTRALELDFRAVGAAQFGELRDEIFLRSEGGAQPIVVLFATPTSGAIFGRIASRLPLDYWFTEYADTSLIVIEEGFATIGL